MKSYIGKRKRCKIDMPKVHFKSNHLDLNYFIPIEIQSTNAPLNICLTYIEIIHGATKDDTGNDGLFITLS